VGMIDIEQPMIRIRLYREGDRYVESANNEKKKKVKRERKKEKGKEKTHVQ
jgi:hypothetical protein